MKFRDESHETLFWFILGKMTCKDVYHQSLAYLIALDKVCREHIEDMYDFRTRRILNCLGEGWQTSTSTKTTSLAYNLFTGDSEWCNCTPSDIFCCSYAPYYWEAVKLRYPEYNDDWE